ERGDDSTTGQAHAPPVRPDRVTLLEREAGPAAAGRLGVGIVDPERGADEVVDEIDLRAGQVSERDLIDQYHRLITADKHVVRRLFAVHVKFVLETRAAAALDAQAQHRPGRFAAENLADAPRRPLRNSHAVHRHPTVWHDCQRARPIVKCADGPGQSQGRSQWWSKHRACARPTRRIRGKAGGGAAWSRGARPATISEGTAIASSIRPPSAAWRTRHRSSSFTRATTSAPGSPIPLRSPRSPARSPVPLALTRTSPRRSRSPTISVIRHSATPGSVPLTAALPKSAASTTTPRRCAQ